MSQDQTDNLLFQAVKNGNESAFEILFELYYASLCRQVSFITKDKMVAEEIVSDLLFKVWIKKETINIHTTVCGYLFLAARNAALDHLRGQKVVTVDVEAANLNLLSEDYTPLDALITEETLNEWEQKISRLPVQRQKVFRMNKLEGKKYKEIARELSLSENTVRNHVQLALQSLSSLSLFILGNLFF